MFNLLAFYGDSFPIWLTGYADAITDGVFMLPDEQQMKFSKFVKLLNTKTDEVYYIQKQCSNLTHELSRLWSHVDEDIPWATAAFGMNEWMDLYICIFLMIKLVFVVLCE